VNTRSVNGQGKGKLLLLNGLGDAETGGAVAVRRDPAAPGVFSAPLCSAAPRPTLCASSAEASTGPDPPGDPR
jgi:hypothetical protein